MIYDTIIIGGGAAGFFTAINLAKQRSDLSIMILERGGQVLEKVRISGGGRCNVTHAEFDPRSLTSYYPRGNRELLGPFHTFMTGDTMAWFEERGVSLKIEEDGRIFPHSDSSQSIIDCFLKEAENLNVEVVTKTPVTAITQTNHKFFISSKSQTYEAKTLVIATGSNPKMLKILEDSGLDIVPAVPSLFTFNIKDERIKDLAGLATEARVRLLDEQQNALKVNHPTIDQEATQGPVLITHWGMSGPGILKLSAWGAHQLNACNYTFTIEVDWLPEIDKSTFSEQLKEDKIKYAKQNVAKWSPYGLPKRFWQSLVKASGIPQDLTWADLNKKMLLQLAQQLRSGIFRVSGKSTFKEEFVTAGGVNLKEIDFKTYQSKKVAGLYLAGEVLDVDAITGGFNFQNAWTGGYIVAQDLAKRL